MTIVGGANFNAEGSIGADVADAYREHGPAVYRMACRVCGPVVAEDVTQDVFVQLWRRPDQYDPERGTLRAFLTKMAHNKAVDAVRSAGSRRAREYQCGDADVDAAGPADYDMLGDEKAARVSTALNRLPSGEREAILAAFYGQHSYREAALVLGQPEGTTKSRIRSGLRRLQVILAEREAVSA